MKARASAAGAPSRAGRGLTPRPARARAPTRRSRSSRWARRCARARGEIVTGCNIENASYGLTLCAERVAVFKAVSEGLRGFDAIAVVADSPRLTAPCGPCRQILWEFCGDIWVHMVDLRGASAHRAHVGAAAPALRRRNL